MVYQDVGGLEVPVDEVVLMDVLDSLEETFHELSDPLLRNFALAHSLEGAAPHILHLNEQMLGGFVNLLEADHAWMV